MSTPGEAVSIVIASASALFSGLIFWHNRASKREERRQAYEKTYLKHSKLISPVILQNWGEGNMNLFPSFSYYSDDYGYRQAREADSKYADQARDHLMKGYPDVYRMYNELIEDSEVICRKMESIIQSYEQTIIDSIAKECPSLERIESYHNLEREGQEMYFLRYLLFNIFDELNLRSRNNRSREFRLSSGTTNIIDKAGKTVREGVPFNNLEFGHVVIAIGKVTTLKALQDVIEQLLSQQDMHEIPREFYGLKEQVNFNEKKGRYFKSISEIHSHVEADMPLNDIDSPEKVCILCPKKPF